MCQRICWILTHTANIIRQVDFQSLQIHSLLEFAHGLTIKHLQGSLTDTHSIYEDPKDRESSEQGAWSAAGTVGLYFLNEWEMWLDIPQIQTD